MDTAGKVGTQLNMKVYYFHVFMRIFNPDRIWKGFAVCFLRLSLSKEGNKTWEQSATFALFFYTNQHITSSIADVMKKK